MNYNKVNPAEIEPVFKSMDDTFWLFSLVKLMT
jgi:hypothetical protein